MHNTCLSFNSTILPSSSFTPPLSPLPSPPHGKHLGVMLVGHALPYISLIFLLFHLTAIILVKSFSFLHHQAISNRAPVCSDVELRIPFHEDDDVSVSADTFSDVPHQKQDITAANADAGFGEEAFFFMCGERHEKDPLLVDEGRDSKEHIFLRKDETFAPDHAVDFLLPAVNVSQHFAFDAINHNLEEKRWDGEGENDATENEKQLGVQIPDFDCKSSKVEEGHPERVTSGSSLAAGESTSNSSVEWRSSTICRDSETEYPFSSSSRRSSSNWESCTMFKRYEEEMIFFDKISAQKLTETESLRSKNAKIVSCPKRMVSKLMAKPRYSCTQDPYQELESAYIAQVCLAWELLNWNYTSFRREECDKEAMNGSYCTSRTAQRFQQFQVLLQRFIENEPYEYGQRPEIFARTRLSSPKLLQVPEFLCDEENQEMDSRISSAEFFSILEDAIQTFMKFLKADSKRLKVCIRRKKSEADLAYLRLLKKINKKKKAKLEEIGRRSKYWKKRKTNEEEQMEVFMAMVDLKVVSRVLRVRRITEEQLHWCEDKMSRVRVWEGKMKRDHSPLFFPVQS